MSATTTSADGANFTAEERTAMKERAREARSARKGAEQAEVTAEVLAKIAAMDPSDRAKAEHVHEIVTAAVPELTPRLWYGMPAWSKDGRIICHFQDAKKFKTRYATLGFSDAARLDDGPMWPNAYALQELTPEAEQRIAALVRQAVG